MAPSELARAWPASAATGGSGVGRRAHSRHPPGGRGLLSPESLSAPASLSADRARQDVPSPPLLIASPNELRTSGWRAVLRHVLQDVGAAPDVTLSGPGALDVDDALAALAARAALADAQRPSPSRFPQFRPRDAERPLPCFAGWADAMQHRLTLRTELGLKAMQLTRADRELLDLLAQHPFLSANDIASFLSRPVRCIHRVLRRFVAVGLALVVERRHGRRR